MSSIEEGGFGCGEVRLRESPVPFVFDVQPRIYQPEHNINIEAFFKLYEERYINGIQL